MPTVDFEARVNTTLESIESNDDIHPDNKAEIREFKRDLKLQGLSYAWLQKLTSHLKVIVEHLEETRFEDMDKGDVKDLVEWAQSRKKEDGEDVSDATVNAYKQVIKRFWRWQADLPRGEHPDETEWINTSNHDGKDTLPDDLLTREDIDALLDACRNSRDQAFIALLWETGARIGELIDLTVGDIEDHQHGRKVVVDGKTGPRRLPLLEATPALNKWLNDHPDPTKDAPLWCQLRKGSEKLSYHYIRQKLLVRPGKRAAKQNPEKFADNENAVGSSEQEIEFHKPLNPHHFRHSRATYMANEFTEAQLCEWFGWVQGSDVPAKYVHLSGRDIDNAYGQLHGLEPEEKEQEKKQAVQDCDRCGELNEPNAAYCMRCGFALDPERVASLQEDVDSDLKKAYADTDPEDTDVQDKIDTLDSLLDDPKVKAALLDRVDNEGSPAQSGNG